MVLALLFALFLGLMVVLENKLLRALLVMPLALIYQADTVLRLLKR